MTRTTTERMTTATPAIAGLVAAVLLAVASPISAQVCLHPDEPLARHGAVSPLAGVGAGATVASVPIAAEVAPFGGTAPGFIAWERWWHLRLYGELSSRAAPFEPVDAILRDDVVAVLREALEGGSDTEREAAAVALGRADAPGGVADLMFALEDAAPPVQQSIVLALGMTGRERVRSFLVALARDARFGRRSLGDRSSPVPVAVRAAAAVGLGHLPPRRDDTTLRDLVVARDTPVEVRLAACIAVGLRPGAAAPAPDRIAGPAECDCHGVELRHVLEDARVDVDCRAALLVSLARVTPWRPEVAVVALSWLGDDDAHLARAAANAWALLADHTPAVRAALWRRAEDPVDMVASAMALLALASHAGDATFTRLARLDRLPRALRPYAAFGLLHAAAGDAGRARAVRDVMRRWMAGDDEPGAGAACLVLGLLGDAGDRGDLSQLVSPSVSSRARGAAVLGLGLLGYDATGDAAARRPSALEQHDRVLARALVHGDCRELVRILRSSDDDYVLGGCARALALCGDGDGAAVLIDLLEEADDERVRAFAVGALGLMLDGERRFGLEHLRAAIPLPVDSPAVMRVLGHL